MRRQTTIEYYQTGDGQAWKATEPESDRELVGRGDTPAEAIAHYGDLLDEVLFESETGADGPTQGVAADD